MADGVRADRKARWNARSWVQNDRTDIVDGKDGKGVDHDLGKNMLGPCY